MIQAVFVRYGSEICNANILGDRVKSENKNHYDFSSESFMHELIFVSREMILYVM